MRFAAGLCWAGTRWFAGRTPWIQVGASGARVGWPVTTIAVEAELQRAQGPVSSWLSWTWLFSEKGDPTMSRVSNIAGAIRPFPFNRASSSRQVKMIRRLRPAGCSRSRRSEKRARSTRPRLRTVILAEGRDA